MVGMAYFVVHIPLTFILFFSGNANTTASAMLALTFLLSSGFYSYLIASTTFRPLTFSALLFYVYGFIMPGLFITRTDNFYWASNALSPDIVAKSAFVTFLATVSLVAGNFITLNAKRDQASEQPKYLDAPARRLTKREMGIILLLAILVALYIGAIIAKFGPLFFLGTRAATSVYASELGLNTTSSGLTRGVSQGLSIALFVLTSFVKYKIESKNWRVNLAFFLSIFLCLLVNNPLFVARFWLIAVMMGFGLTVAGGVFERHKTLIFASTPALMFLVFPTLGNFNRRGGQLDFTFDLIEPAKFMSHGDLDGFQSMTNIVHLISLEGLSYGTRLLSALFFFVPRSIWHGKHQPTGADAAEAAGYVYTNISMPLPGELYADGGVLLVVIGMFFIGMWLRNFDSIYAKLKHADLSGHRISLPIFTALLAGFAPIIMRGSLLGVIGGIGVAVCLVLLWRLLSILRISQTV